MRIIKTLLRNLHRYVFLLMACAFLLTWFYYIATELPAKKKVAVYINAPEVRSRALEAELEKSLPEGIKAIRVHPFAYDIMGVGLPAEADILIMTGSDIEHCFELLMPLEDAPEGAFIKDGIAYGAPFCGCGEFIGFADGEDHYICFAKSSVHTGKYDNAAFEVARILLDLKEGNHED